MIFSALRGRMTAYRTNRVRQRSPLPSKREVKMQTGITITTIRDDGTPFGTELTVGDVAQKHVLRSFNPSGDAKVDATKVLCAAIIQQMRDLRDGADATP